MDGTQNLNLNATECLARAYEFGGTTIRNICSGTQTFAPWGSLDWIGMISIMAVGALIAAFMATLFFRIIFDLF